LRPKLPKTPIFLVKILLSSSYILGKTWLTACMNETIIFAAGAGVHPQPEEADVSGGHVVPTVRTHHLEVTQCMLSTSMLDHFSASVNFMEVC